MDTTTLVGYGWCQCGVKRSRQDGWTRRRDGVWVCPRCELPSRREHARLVHVVPSLEALGDRATEEMTDDGA